MWRYNLWSIRIDGAEVVMSATGPCWPKHWNKAPRFFTIWSLLQPWLTLTKDRQSLLLNWPIIGQTAIDNQNLSTPLTFNRWSIKCSTQFDEQPTLKWREMTRILAPSNVYALPQHLHQGPRVPTETIKAQQQSEQSSITNLSLPFTLTHVLPHRLPLVWYCLGSRWQDAK